MKLYNTKKEEEIPFHVGPDGTTRFYIEPGVLGNVKGRPAVLDSDGSAAQYYTSGQWSHTEYVMRGKLHDPEGGAAVVSYCGVRLFYQDGVLDSGKTIKALSEAQYDIFAQQIEGGDSLIKGAGVRGKESKVESPVSVSLSSASTGTGAHGAMATVLGRVVPSLGSDVQVPAVGKENSDSGALGQNLEKSTQNLGFLLGWMGVYLGNKFQTGSQIQDQQQKLLSEFLKLHQIKKEQMPMFTEAIAVGVRTVDMDHWKLNVVLNFRESQPVRLESRLDSNYMTYKREIGDYGFISVKNFMNKSQADFKKKEEQEAALEQWGVKAKKEHEGELMSELFDTKYWPKNWEDPKELSAGNEKEPNKKEERLLVANPAKVHNLPSFLHSMSGTFVLQEATVQLKNGVLHSENGPAYKDKNITLYAKNGLLHAAENTPALLMQDSGSSLVVYANEGLLDRKGGAPAVVKLRVSSEAQNKNASGMTQDYLGFFENGQPHAEVDMQTGLRRPALIDFARSGMVNKESFFHQGVRVGMLAEPLVPNAINAANPSSDKSQDSQTEQTQFGAGPHSIEYTSTVRTPYGVHLSRAEAEELGHQIPVIQSVIFANGGQLHSDIEPCVYKNSNGRWERTEYYLHGFSISEEQWAKRRNARNTGEYQINAIDGALTGACASVWLLTGGAQSLPGAVSPSNEKLLAYTTEQRWGWGNLLEQNKNIHDNSNTTAIDLALKNAVRDGSNVEVIKLLINAAAEKGFDSKNARTLEGLPVKELGSMSENEKTLHLLMQHVREQNVIDSSMSQSTDTDTDTRIGQESLELSRMSEAEKTLHLLNLGQKLKTRLSERPVESGAQTNGSLDIKNTRSQEGQQSVEVKQVSESAPQAPELNLYLNFGRRSFSAPSTVEKKPKI